MAKIIYHCFGGTHSSVLAAAVHLNILQKGRLPSNRDILNCPYFDRINKNSSGKMFFVGVDEMGHEIFTMGCRGAGSIVETAVKDVLYSMGIDDKDIIMMDTKPSLNFLMKMGGFLSRRLNLITTGRLLLFSGSRISFNRIVGLVEKVKKDKV